MTKPNNKSLFTSVSVNMKLTQHQVEVYTKQAQLIGLSLDEYLYHIIHNFLLQHC